MSGIVFDDVTTALSQIFTAKLADQRNKDCVELNSVNIVPNDSGQNVAWGAKFSGTRNAGNFADGEDIDPSEYTKTVKVPAVLGFGNYRAPVEVGDVAAVLAAAASGSPDELNRLVESELGDGIVELTNFIASDFWVGDGTGAGGDPSIVGITGGAAISTGHYAGIDRGTYPEFAGNVLANGGIPRPLTDDLLRQGEALIFTAGGRPANRMLTSTGVHRKYAGLFGSTLRVNTGGQMAPQLAMGTMDLNWGGMPVVRTPKAPTGTLLMYNADNVELVFPNTLTQFAATPMNQMAVKMGMDLKGTFMLPIIVQPIAKVGNASRYNVWTLVQLRIKRPNECALIQDISES